MGKGGRTLWAVFFGLNLLDNSEKLHRVKEGALDKEPEDQADPRSAA